MNSTNRLRITNGNVRETYFASAQTGIVFVSHERRKGSYWYCTGTQEVGAEKARDILPRLTLTAAALAYRGLSR